MPNLDAIKKQLTVHEGRKSFPYQDTVGKVTIGVGWNLTDNGLPDSIIDDLLDLSIGKAELDLDETFPWWRDLDEVRQRVLLDMCFNMGINKLAKFKRTLGAIRQQKWNEAAEFMLDSLWATQVGKRAKRLAHMMRTGQVPRELL